jgi:opine dehydrogenase
MDTGFEEFAEAVATRSGGDVSAPPRYDRVTVLGGGSDALLLSALCLAEGADVTLFSAYGAELDALRGGHGIALRGAGPVGNYQVDRDDAPSIATTAELDRAVAGAEVIFLTGPVHKQRTYAMVLADHIRDGQVLVLAPGRSFGAAEAAWLLRVGGTKADYTLVEVQGLPYWHAVAGNQLHLSVAGGVSAATLPAGRGDAVEGLRRFLPNLLPVINTVRSSFDDGSGLVEVPALLIGGPAVKDGLPTVPDGAVALAENNTFRALIGPQHEAIMVRMAQERMEVAKRFGVRDLPGLGEWQERHAGALKGEGSRPVPPFAKAQKIVRCATIGSLVPLVSAARMAGVPVPATEAMVTLAGTVLGAEMSTAGRRLEAIGIDSDHIEDARRLLDAIATGAR